MSEQHDAVIPAGCILECLSPGLEVRKNIIRKADCVVSLGPEKVEEEVKAEAAGETEEDAAGEAGALRDAGDVGDGEVGVEQDDGAEEAGGAEETPAGDEPEPAA